MFLKHDFTKLKLLLFPSVASFIIHKTTVHFLIEAHQSHQLWCCLAILNPGTIKSWLTSSYAIDWCRFVPVRVRGGLDHQLPDGSLHDKRL